MMGCSTEKKKEPNFASPAMRDSRLTFKLEFHIVAASLRHEKNGDVRVLDCKVGSDDVPIVILGLHRGLPPWSHDRAESPKKLSLGQRPRKNNKNKVLTCSRQCLNLDLRP